MRSGARAPASEALVLHLVDRAQNQLRLFLGPADAGGVTLALEPGPTLYRLEARFRELVAPEAEALQRAYPAGDPWSAALGKEPH